MTTFGKIYLIVIDLFMEASAAWFNLFLNLPFIASRPHGWLLRYLQIQLRMLLGSIPLWQLLVESKIFNKAFPMEGSWRATVDRDPAWTGVISLDA